jgi:hypothetical protein
MRIKSAKKPKKDKEKDKISKFLLDKNTKEQIGSLIV